MSEAGKTAISLRDNLSALKLLHAILKQTIEAFPAAFEATSLPDDITAFRHSYPDFLPAFETSRLLSTQRAAIARFMSLALQNSVVTEVGDSRIPLTEALAQRSTRTAAQSAAVKLDVFQCQGSRVWTPDLTFHDRNWRGAEIADLGELLVSRGFASPGVASALKFVADHVLDDGELGLRHRKIAVMGAGAEMAPTRYWLAAGADVLWLDTHPVPSAWLKDQQLSGRLFVPQGNTDLLADPGAALAAIVAFADGDSVDLGLYAYAPGQARELLLTAAMNAIVETLPKVLVKSVTMLVSPTTPSELLEHDLQTMQSLSAARPGWISTCLALGLLRDASGPLGQGAKSSNTVVQIQGASYQAAQYVGKVLTAESWHNYGPLQQPDATRLRVSANTAAITRTRSLAHPLFAAAFEGAAAFGVATLSPAQSSQLNGLLSIADWFQQELPVPGQVRVHGGIHTLPYPLNSALRIAAAIGFLRSPRLLMGFIKN